MKELKLSCIFLCGQRELYREDARIFFNGKFQSENFYRDNVVVLLIVVLVEEEILCDCCWH